MKKTPWLEGFSRSRIAAPFEPWLQNRHSLLQRRLESRRQPAPRPAASRAEAIENLLAFPPSPVNVMHGCGVEGIP
jgi:hypothetical protein